MISRRSIPTSPFRLLMAIVAAAGCSSDNGGSGVPGPAVTSIDVAPPAPAIFVADTVQLTATVKDQSGNAMTGKTPTWSSSNPALATVSATGLLIGVAPGVATITASADGKHGTATVNVSDPGPRITTEPGTTASALIGSRGGSISTTSAAGIQYTLAIPVGALMSPVQITMTPITGVRKLPVSGGLAGGVAFGPSGLRFANAATLRISNMPSRGAGLRPIGLTADGDASLLVPAPVIDSGTVLILPVSHFSGAMVGYGTTDNLEAIVAGSGSANSDDAFYLDLLDLLSNETPVNSADELQTMKDWFQHVILPAFNNASNDSLLLNAVAEYNFWSSAAPDALGIVSPKRTPTAYATELAQLAPVAAAAFRAAIDGNNNLCQNSQSFTALFNVLFWQERAADLGVGTSAFGLDRPAVLNTLCANLTLTLGDLPNPMDLGADYSMDFRFAVQFVLNGTPQVWPQEVTIPPSAQLLVADPSGLTDDTGLYTSVVSPQVVGADSVTVMSCLVDTANNWVTDVCGTAMLRSQTIGLLSVTSASLPAGNVGANYLQTLNATGGIGSYAWSISLGSLPPGLSLNGSTGAISGVPAAAGTFSFTAMVTSGPRTASGSLSILVAPIQQLTFHFDASLEGWIPGATFLCSVRPCGSDWGNVRWSVDFGPNFMSSANGAVELDGTGNPARSNAWISKQFVLPSSVSSIDLDTWAHNRLFSDGELRIRLVDNAGVSHTLDDQVITGGETHIASVVHVSVGIGAWAGQAVTIFIEQNDNGSQGVLPGENEQVYIDNIQIH